MLISDGYFENFEIKKLEINLQNDENYDKEKNVLNVTNQIRMSLITNRSADEINDENMISQYIL